MIGYPLDEWVDLHFALTVFVGKIPVKYESSGESANVNHGRIMGISWCRPIGMGISMGMGWDGNMMMFFIGLVGPRDIYHHPYVIFEILDPFWSQVERNYPTTSFQRRWSLRFSMGNIIRGFVTLSAWRWVCRPMRTRLPGQRFCRYRMVKSDFQSQQDNFPPGLERPWCQTFPRCPDFSGSTSQRIFGGFVHRKAIAWSPKRTGGTV